METKKCFEVNGHKSTTYQNVWATVRTVLRGKFIALKLILEKNKYFTLISPLLALFILLPGRPLL